MTFFLTNISFDHLFWKIRIKNYILTCKTWLWALGFTINTQFYDSFQCLAGTHHSRPCWSAHGYGRVCPDSVGSRSRCTLTSILELPEAVFPGSDPPWRGEVCSLAPEVPLFREMPTGPEEFLEPLGVSGLQSCVRTHKKGLVPHSSSRWDEQQILIKFYDSVKSIYSNRWSKKWQHKPIQIYHILIFDWLIVLTTHQLVLGVLWLEVRETRTLKIHIYIFCV